MSRRSLILTSCTFLSLVSYSCTHGIDSPTDNPKLTQSLPANWTEAGKGNSGKISTGWIKEFQSQSMEKLVREALANNPSIRATEARLRASWHTTSVANQDLKPSLSGSLNTSGTRSENGNSVNSYSSSLRANLNASWEPDFWGQIRDGIDADRADYTADLQNLRNARLSLAASTARAWCNLITAKQQLQLAQRTLDSFEKNNRIVERNYKAGVAGTGSLAVQLSRSNVSSAKSSLRNRELLRGNAARSIELLLGRYPKAEIQSGDILPEMTDTIPSSLPARILARRPDIASAENAVFASAKRADVARKNLLPNIRFTTGISSSDNSLSQVFRMDNLVMNAAANLTQTLYDGGNLKAVAQAALETNRAAIENYADTVLDAANEIEQALATDLALKDREQFLIDQTKSSTLAEKQAERDYSEGLENSGILEVLESQRRANNARSSLIDIRNQRLQNRIALHLALGGDYFTPRE